MSELGLEPFLGAPCTVLLCMLPTALDPGDLDPDQDPVTGEWSPPSLPSKGENLG